MFSHEVWDDHPPEGIDDFLTLYKWRQSESNQSVAVKSLTWNWVSFFSLRDIEPSLAHSAFPISSRLIGIPIFSRGTSNHEGTLRLEKFLLSNQALSKGNIFMELYGLTLTFQGIKRHYKHIGYLAKPQKKFRLFVRFGVRGHFCILRHRPMDRPKKSIRQPPISASIFHENCDVNRFLPS